MCLTGSFQKIKQDKNEAVPNIVLQILFSYICRYVETIFKKTIHVNIKKRSHNRPIGGTLKRFQEACWVVITEYPFEN